MMNSSLNSRKLGVVALLGLAIALFALVSSASAVPAAFDWGSANTDSIAPNGYGIVDTDGTTALQPGDIAQLLHVGDDGEISRPYADGSAGGDDMLLDTTEVSDANYPPPFRGFGFIPSKLFNYDTEDPIEGGTVYMRVWNDSAITEDSCYGDSATTTLSNLTSFNSPSFATDACAATLAVSLNQTSSTQVGIGQLALQVAAVLGLATLLVFGYRKVALNPIEIRNDERR